MPNISTIAGNILHDSGVNIDSLQPILTNPVTGTGTSGTIPKFTGTSTLGNSLITDNGSNALYNGSILATQAWITQQGYVSGGPFVQNVLNNSGDFNLNVSGQQAFFRFSQGQWVNGPVSGNYSHVLSVNGAADNRTVQIYLGDVPGYVWWRPNQGGTWHPWERILTSNNYNSYAPTLSGGGASGTWSISISGNADSVDGYHATNAANGLAYYASNGYLYVPSWINVDNGGIYSNTNSAHFRPNPGSYGSWLVTGTRNGYAGIEFESLSNGNVSLMVYANSNETGFHNNSYGWQFRWGGGTLFVYKNNYGGGTEATVLDSSNYTSYAPTLTGGGASGTWGINITGSAGSVDFNNLTNKTGGSGTYQTSGFFTAAAFYDTNTTYYADFGAAAISLNIAGSIRTTLSSGTMFSHGSMNDALGYNGSYGTYIGSPVGGTYYIYANGQMYNNGPIVTLLHSGNYNSYSPTLTGGGASGTWGINITGDANTVDGVDSSQIVYGGAGRASTSSSDMNDTNQKSGFYYQYNPTGAPYTEWWNWMTVAGNGWQSSNNYEFQLAHDFHSDGFYVRRMTNGSIFSWRRILDSVNYNSYAPTLTGGGASGTWSINITGSAGSASTASQVTINYNNDSNSTYQLLWGSGNSVYGTSDVYVNPYTDVINARGGYISNSNPWGTSNSAYFPNGITTAGGTNWVYGFTYIGNAPGNGSGVQISSDGSSYFRSGNTSGNWGYAGLFVDRNNAANNYVPWSFENEYGNHSWGIVARFHIQQAGADRPSIQFSASGGNDRWSLGYCTSGDWNFRITQNQGYRTDNSTNDGWGTERFRIDTDGTTHVGLNGGTVNLYFGGSLKLYTGSDGTRNTGWAYHTNNGTGLHWPNNGWHLMPASASDFRIHSGSGTDSALRFETAGTTRGYVYAENDNTIGFLTNGRSWAFRTYSNGDARVYGYLTVQGAGTSSSIYMSDSDEGQREIHCNSNRIGFLTQAGSWGAWLYDGADWEAASSVRAPIFYDSNDTSYYGNFASFSLFNQLGIADWQYIGGQTSNGQSNYQWDGATYRNPGDWTARLIVRRDNSSTGINGSIPSLVLFNNHGGDQTTVSMVFASNECASGSNSVNLAGIIAKKEAAGNCGGWSPGSLTFFVKDYGTRRDAMYIATSGYVQSDYSFRAPIFYDSEDTGYYADFHSTSQSAIRVRGGALHGPNPTWGKYLLVGGDGRQGYIDNADVASVSTTNGNLHLDAASGYGFYINWYDGSEIYFGRGNSSSGSAFVNSSGNWNFGSTSSASYLIHARGDIYADGGWLRVSGTSGLYFESYGGGWHMTDSTWIRSYNGKNVYMSADVRTGGQFQLESGYSYWQRYGTWSSSLHRIAYMSFDWDGSYNTYSNHGISSTDSAGSFGDSMSVNSFNDITLRLDSNNNNTNSYLRISDNTTGNGTFAWIGREGGVGAMYLQRTDASGITSSPSGTSFTIDSGGNNYITFRNTADNATYSGLAFVDNNIGGYVIFGNYGATPSDAIAIAGYQGGILQYGSANSVDPSARTTVASWNSTGLQVNNGDLRATIFYDISNTAYYCDPAGTTNLYAISNYTYQGAFNMGRMDTVRRDITSDQNYWGGAWGWGTNYGTWANAWKTGFSSWDIWGYGTDHPQGSGYIHAQGIISGQHYCTADGGAAYGWMMVGAGDATPNRYWLRGKWGSGTSSWTEMMTSNNNPYAWNMNQYVRTSDNVEFNGVTVRATVTVGSYGNSSSIYMTDGDEGTREIHCNSNRVGFLNQSGSWGSWCDDTGNWRTDHAMYASNWFRSYGYTGLYNEDYGSHIRPTYYASHGTWEIYGYTKGGYNGLNVYDAQGYINNYMHESGNGGLYQENGSGWIFYWYRPNSCLGIGTSATSSSYKMYVNGAIYSTNDIVAYSDRRKKTDIVTIENALEKVLNLRGVFYTKTDEEDKGRKTGVIAQEVYEVLPEVVTYAADVDEYGVSYGNMSGVLIEAIKEQNVLIKTLRSEIDELKAKLV